MQFVLLHHVITVLETSEDELGRILQITKNEDARALDGSTKWESIQSVNQSPKDHSHKPVYNVVVMQIVNCLENVGHGKGYNGFR